MAVTITAMTIQRNLLQAVNWCAALSYIEKSILIDRHSPVAAHRGAAYAHA